jgi:hypothetical protein
MVRGYRASGENVGLKPSTDKSQLLNCAAPSILILRIAALVVAGSLAIALPARAEGFWSDDDYYRYYEPAPMPFMQRITWSGIAMHAGVLPGYPASHGCIRMPMAFAVKMYGWTRMGARVIIAPDDMVPASFSHPLLVAQKPVPPQPNASDKTDKAAPSPAIPPQANLDLKPTVGHDARLTAAMAQAPSPAPLAEQTHTAEATVSPAIKTDVAMTDASSSAQSFSAGAPQPAIPADAAKPDAQAAPKDQGRMSDAGTLAAPSSTAPRKHYGPISIFISRKDSKLYVRQDFAPLFDVPVTIAPGDRPLGTHIFTAEADKNDANVLHWSVISLPQRNAKRRDEEHASRRRKAASAVETKPVPDSPAEALDRITIPPDAMTRITEALSNGSSIIVSDQGIAAGETGEGTEFIVSLR